MLYLPPNTGWIFNTIVPANITGEAAHRRATCGNASNPCNIKGASVIGVRGKRVVVDGTTANRVKGEGFGQSRPLVLMSVLGGNSSQRRPRFCRSKPSILIGTQERPHRLHHARSFGERVIEIDQHHDAGLGGDAGERNEPDGDAHENCIQSISHTPPTRAKGRSTLGGAAG